MRRHAKSVAHEGEPQSKRLCVALPRPWITFSSAGCVGTGAVLAEMVSVPSDAVSIIGTVIHMHPNVFCRLPYFTAELDVAWSDTACPQLKLPCSVSEFALLIQRLSTGHLGSNALPVLDCASALRLAVAAGILSIDDVLPELSGLLRVSIACADDVAVVLKAAHALPISVASIVQSLGHFPAC